TYLGGGGTGGSDNGFGIAVDGAGTAYVIGTTSSAAFPVANATQSTYGGGMCTLGIFTIPCPDVFVSKLVFSNNTLTLPYSTYLGGSSEDWGYSIAVSSGNIYITGYTSGGFPIVNGRQSAIGGGYDGFITKIQDIVTKKVRGQVISD